MCTEAGTYAMWFFTSLLVSPRLHSRFADCLSRVTALAPGLQAGIGENVEESSGTLGILGNRVSRVVMN